jgi:hypothetical protein
MAPQEIADELGLTGNAVRQAIFKARRNLERALGRTRPGHIPADAWASPTGRVVLDGGARAAEDWLATALRAAGTWLREGIEANERGRERVRREVLARASRGRSR